MPIDRKSIVVMVTVSAGCWLPVVVQAHRLDVWAHAEGNGYILVEATYASGEGAAGVLVEASDPDGVVLAKGRTDADGKYRFTIREIPEHMNIVAKTDDGHKGSITLAHDDLKTVSAKMEDTNPAILPETTAKHSHPDSGEEEILQMLARQEIMLLKIERDLELIKKPRSGVSMERVLAGIGFIVGLSGMAAYGLSRRERGG